MSESVKFAAGILIESRNTFLFGRSTNTDMYTIPKGVIEPDETQYDAAIRETLEETSLDLIALNIVPKYFHTFTYTGLMGQQKRLTVYHAKDEDGILYDQNIVCTSMVNQDPPFPEIDHFIWLPISEAKRYAFKSQHSLIDKMINHLAK